LPGGCVAPAVTHSDRGFASVFVAAPDGLMRIPRNLLFPQLEKILDWVL
jgi:hypothetical protein